MRGPLGHHPAEHLCAAKTQCLCQIICFLSMPLQWLGERKDQIIPDARIFGITGKIVSYVHVMQFSIIDKLLNS